MSNTSLLSSLILRPDTAGYDTARAAWNAHADQRPAAVAVAHDVAQVQAAIAYAREHDLRIAPQTTGHFAVSLPALDGTLLLRLAFDQAVTVDPLARVARIPAGAQWRDVVEAVAAHGLAVMHGSSPTVSPFGYLLGGGLSFYGRAHGLAVNHVRAFEIVTPDGVVRRADAEQNSDFFWALRGGGGGYAVVTAIEIGLLPYETVTAGALVFAPHDAGSVLRAWRDWARTAPEAITTSWRLIRPPGESAVVIVDGVSLEPGAAADLEARLREAARPVAGGYGPMPTAAVPKLHGDPEDPTPGIWDGMLLERLDDAAIARMLGVAVDGGELMIVELRQIGGALAAAPDGAGARGSLEGEFASFALGVPPVTGSPEAIRGALRELAAALEPVATGTRFANFSGRSGSLRGHVPDEALPRLAAVRSQADPGRVLVAPHAA